MMMCGFGLLFGFFVVVVVLFLSDILYGIFAEGRRNGVGVFPSPGW